MAVNKVVTLDMLTVVADQTSPATATYQVTTPMPGMSKYKSLRFLATITGGTGGALDVIIENSSDGVTWYEFAHFPSVAAAAVKTYTCSPSLSDVMKEVGKNNLTGSTLTTNMILNAGDLDGGPWLDQMRVRYVGGAGTSVGAAQSIKVIAMSELYS